MPTCCVCGVLNPDWVELILCNGIFVHNQEDAWQMPEQLRKNVLHHSHAANAAGTLLVKDGSHVAPEHFFATASVLCPLQIPA